jgi:hypothetical protein
VLRRWSRRSERDEGFWREALVYAALAGRTTSLIDVCGEPQVVDEIQPILEAIWDGVSRRRRANGPSPLRRIERIAGPDEPDDDQPIYLVYEAMEALHAAALMAFGLRYDLAPMDLGQGIHSALDGVIRFTLDPRPIIVDPRNPPPPVRSRQESARRQCETAKQRSRCRSRRLRVRSAPPRKSSAKSCGTTSAKPFATLGRSIGTGEFPMVVATDTEREPTARPSSGTMDR